MRLRSVVGRCALVLLLLFSVGGCAWQRGRTNIADLHNRVDQVQPGTTTSAQLLNILGSPPNNIIALPEGRSILLYTFGDSKTNAFDIIFLRFAKTNVGIDSALFTMKDGVVESTSIGTNSRDLAWEFWPFGD